MSAPSPHLSDIHLQVLVFISLLGEASDEQVSHVSDLPPEDCEAELLDLANNGMARWGGGSADWTVTDLGRAEHAKQVARELAGLGLRDEVQAAYDAVLAAGDDHPGVERAAEALAGRMRRFGAYVRRLRAASTGTFEPGWEEKWDEVRDQFLADLRITLGL